MVSIIIAGIIVLVAVGAWLGFRSEYTNAWALVPLGFIIGIALVIGSSFAMVPARNVGVPTSFGKPTGDTYGPGLHFIPPWVTVTDIDATVQTEEYKGDTCIYAKIADGSTACLSLAYRWRINPDAADTIYQDYRKSDTDINDAVRSALVSTNIKASINEVMASYDPLADLKSVTGDITPEQLAAIDIKVAPDYEKLNADITASFNAKIADVGDLVTVQQITVSYVKLSDTAEKRINDYQASVQATRIAIQDQARKAAEAKGNDLLAESLNNTGPTVLVSKCLDALNTAIENNYALPAGFNCFGSTGSVVIPSK